MPRAIALRSDFSAVELRHLARRSKDAGQARRLLALAAIYDGGTRSAAARLGNVTLQMVRDWVVRFSAEGPMGLIDRKVPGPTPLLADAHRVALAAQIDRGPIPAAHGVVRWRLCDLGQWLWEGFRVSVSMQTLSREVRAIGYRKLSARPKHQAQAEGAIEAFKKTSPPRWQAPREQSLGLDAIEIWFANEARVGQKNGITRRWARRGTRPSAPQDQRYASTDIFGAVCPQDGKGAALVLSLCNTAAMNLHLAEISAMVSPGKHAVLLLDQAGWHLSGDVAVPPNITLLPLPPKCPELNVMENVWQFMRENWLSNRVFRDYHDIVGHCCHHWNRLIDQPWRIMSIGLRDWAHGF
jgi:transposase